MKKVFLITIAILSICFAQAQTEQERRSFITNWNRTFPSNIGAWLEEDSKKVQFAFEGDEDPNKVADLVSGLYSNKGFEDMFWSLGFTDMCFPTINKCYNKAEAKQLVKLYNKL